MAQTSHTISAYSGVADVWRFVCDMENWAPLMPGYVSHQKINDRESKWKIRGDLGPFSRVVEFAVTITEWNEPCPDGLIVFKLKGLNELVEGAGSFKLEPLSGEQGDPGQDGKPITPSETSWLGRFYAWLFKVIRPFRKTRVGVTSDFKQDDLSDGNEAVLTLMTLTLELNPGGPMGKVVDKIIAPLLPTEAQGLASKILSEVEAYGRRQSLVGV